MAGIWKRGNYWRAEIRRVGYPSQWRTFDTKAEAEAWARRLESEMDRGTFVDRTEAERNTFGDLLRRYAHEVSPLKKGAADEILRINKVCRDSIAKYKVAALSGKLFSEYRDRRLAGNADQRPVSGSTVSRELTLLSHVLNVARREWGVHLDINPVSVIRRPRENRARNRRLMPGEEQLLLAALAFSPRDNQGRFSEGGCRNEWALPAVILAIETAMRRGEMLSLRWDDVFLKERFVRLHDTKNGDARDVPLSSRAVLILESMVRHESGCVFPITGEALKRVFIRACDRAGIENLHFHDLRHEATSRIAERLDNILELSAVTGHKTVQMLKRYYHPRASDIAARLG
ncbi:site-specific integrase [Paraburkholderia sp. UYCP14C]|uniref:site-specific integrase n=1 Tax=Paraburkholderia sp. UYCP14C TaxID=2511130 RepID=UPI00101FB80E|nr:site-specific integrase [Paraburkholderia sp. UYCP14C]RZF30977.1 site-specific integrase [Paraburkholderia sp. UYCP14C]